MSLWRAVLDMVPGEQLGVWWLARGHISHNQNCELCELQYDHYWQLHITSYSEQYCIINIIALNTLYTYNNLYYYFCNLIILLLIVVYALGLWCKLVYSTESCTVYLYSICFNVCGFPPDALVFSHIPKTCL